MHRSALAVLLMFCTAAPCLAASPDANEARARGIFSRLIAFKTETGEGQVPAMAAYLAGEFRNAGFPEADVHILPLDDTASLVVRYQGDGSGGKPIVLMAHMDVVTAKPEDWQRDPFTLVEENGYFFGPGTYDVKNGVASLTSTFLRLKQEGFLPTRSTTDSSTGTSC